MQSMYLQKKYERQIK